MAIFQANFQDVFFDSTADKEILVLTKFVEFAHQRTFQDVELLKFSRMDMYGENMYIWK
jgi:hypothetical protein